MTKPESFILTTDYPTLKNDNSGIYTVAVPASIVIPGNSSVQYSTDASIGTQGAISSVQISSTKDSNTWYQAQTCVYTRNSAGGLYSIAAFVWRVSPTVLRCQVHIVNPYSVPITGEAGAETITFRVSTFVPPYA
ncbi:hypothetical protein EOL96_08990 [Candidatus Saccharibacteria bacterium]|nr:hypothetical protein [Candidatus Saccharibacteria bacterium]